MSDFIREVNEEYRRDRAVEAWKRYYKWIIAGAVLVVLATAGWGISEHQRKLAAEAAGSQFEAAVQMTREGKDKEAEAAFLEIARTGPSGYALLARFRAAAEIGARDSAEAVKIYDALAADPKVDAVFQSAARLRAALLLVDSADAAAIRQRIEPLAAPTSPFRHSARELLGLSALRAGDLENAGRWFDMVVADPQAPQGLRERAGTMLGLVAGGRKAESASSETPNK